MRYSVWLRDKVYKKMMWQRKAGHQIVRGLVVHGKEFGLNLYGNSKPMEGVTVMLLILMT